ncbi:MAG: molecular chaperone HtpG [Anaerolineaceae bacterium]|nr:molecular chaperone HtpG [Anaerolineaceae bacterium]
MTKKNTINTFEYKAETQQLLNILIHSLYSDRDVFLRELISNAADALTKFHYKSLITTEVKSPEVELGIWIKTIPDQNMLIIRDTGIGMSKDEIIENLGTIAHSGAAAFLEQIKDTSASEAQHIIGQFGVGFYAAFMVAESIEVVSSSWDTSETSVSWLSQGEKSYQVSESKKQERGTEIIVHLKEDAKEYTDIQKIKRIIQKHSNYIPYPVYIGEETEPANEQTAIWRQQPASVEKEKINDFYKQYTLDFSEPMQYLQLAIDAPIQLFALLYVPSLSYNPSFSLRKQDGLQLYCRNILLQEFSRDLLPDYLRFIQGVVDSEDIPINVSRETIQSNKVVTQIRKILTGKILDKLADMAEKDTENYLVFWNNYGDFLKEGITTNPEDQERLIKLIRFNTRKYPAETISFQDYVDQKTDKQKKIYYFLDNENNQMDASPHLDIFKKYDLDVIHFKTMIDPFMVLRIPAVDDLELINVANPQSLEDIEEIIEQKEDDQADSETPTNEEEILSIFRKSLEGKISEIRSSKVLVDSPVRITVKEGSLPQELQSAYRLMKQEMPEAEKVLEVNLSHPIIQQIPDINNDSLTDEIIEYLYETGMLLDGNQINQAEYSKRYLNILTTLLTKK